MSTKEAVPKSQVKSSMTGNAMAQRDFLRSTREAEIREAAEIERSHEFWNEYIAITRAEIAAAAAAGAPPPNPLPHPDDIVIEPGKRVRFTGPIDEQEAQNFQDTLSFIDLLILQTVHDERIAPSKQKLPPGMNPGESANFLARLLNSTLPKRLQLDDNEIFMREMRYGRLTKRELLKRVVAGRRARGKHRRRGATLPPLDAFKPIFENVAILSKVLSESMES